MYLDKIKNVFTYNTSWKTYGVMLSLIIASVLIDPGRTDGSSIFKCPTSGSGRLRYGDKCQYECHCVNQSEQCDVLTGACSSGCDFNWVGPGCQFKNIAFRQDSRHVSNIYPPLYSDLANDDSLTTCSRTSDKNSVAPWWNIWIPEYATVRKIELLTTANITNCNNRFYGRYGCENCSENCSETHYTGQMTCNLLDGGCLDGCKAGWTGYRCETECDDGKWGINCTNDCGSCLSSPCNHVNGRCEGGCSSGYKSTLQCDIECDPGYYGRDCKQKCNRTCSEIGSALCYNVNGTCINGCIAGYEGSYCEFECDDGKWGINCTNDCGSCLSSPCYHETGSCDGGCSSGYKSTLQCDIECDPGYYGKDCKQKCNRTCSETGDALCNSVMGTCINGCIAGYGGSYCELVSDRALSITDPIPGDDEASKLKLVLICLGSFCLIIVVYATVITVLFKRKTTQNENDGTGGAFNRPLSTYACTDDTFQATIAETAAAIRIDPSVDNRESHFYTNLTPKTENDEGTYDAIELE
ncbi:multiple epidermal growth factor-like domains protein 10 isoform X2 [Ruditapes philippinarum]|uniref:multiple epidermal growth factor-like domains protein 10 isoform X2 n=1 Tax=Ruditapes philippinarum TaxID=129788 RepID=UPI00295B2B46|nr:multiple epidermal growth factor-like domains protein 10 isoform X2 [Ruditapes philippinarum]